MASSENLNAKTEEVMAEVEGVLEPVGLQEEAELPARILEEFVKTYVAQEDTAQSPDNLVSEDTSRQKATEVKEEWKKLKAVYLKHMEILRCGFTKALPQVAEIQRKYTELREAVEQLQAKKQVLVEKHEAAQKHWQLQQKRIQSLEEISAEIKGHQKRARQKLDGSHQELETLKQQAGQELEKLKKNQTYLQLLYALQNKLAVSEDKDKEEEKDEDEDEDEDEDSTALPPPPESL
ncbi:ZW10 interactor isoform X2 [Acomys russatus]|uniref:ZW10 interactor isoform X2 n=1 Tax=Acomys russatus TaxID=60746 RepID=UPI0021E1D928|nr:ZW10 interactor isoform X2 [Acomys russatus]